MKEEIRVVDFSRAANFKTITESAERNSKEDLTKISKEIVECFEKIGFVYIKNHGIPQEHIDKVFKLSEAFFSLPSEVKKSYAKKEIYSSGYLGPSAEIFNKSIHVKELRESFDVYPFFKECVPSEIEDLKQFLQQMYGILSDLLKKVLRCLEIGLDLPFGKLLNQHTNINSESSVTALRLIHYPQILFEVPENCIRCGEHTDYGTITFLFQDNIGGLEVKNRNNEWVQAHPVPGAILVNVGDMLQTLTSGRLVATPHRVLIPEEERRKRCSRKSVAFFVNPNKEVVLKPFGVPDDDKKSYRTAHEHLHSRLSSALIL